MDKHYFTNDYLPKMHRIGKITGVLGVFASFLPALVLGFGHGLWPDLREEIHLSPHQTGGGPGGF